MRRMIIVFWEEERERRQEGSVDGENGGFVGENVRIVGERLLSRGLVQFLQCLSSSLFHRMCRDRLCALAIKLIVNCGLGVSWPLRQYERKY